MTLTSDTPGAEKVVIVRLMPDGRTVPIGHVKYFDTASDYMIQYVRGPGEGEWMPVAVSSKDCYIVDGHPWYR